VNYFQVGTDYFINCTAVTQADEDTAILQPVTNTQLPKPGVDLIKEFEGFYPDAYPDPLTGGRPYTIGWGSTKKRDGTRWQLGETITRDEADALLIHQLETNYLPPLQKIPVWPELNVNQQGALLSFAYNLGANFYDGKDFQTITRVLKNKLWNEIESAFLLYCNPGSNVEAGLKRRRQAEARLFLR
jgi:lysozyme